MGSFRICKPSLSGVGRIEGRPRPGSHDRARIGAPSVGTQLAKVRGRHDTTAGDCPPDRLPKSCRSFTTPAQLPPAPGSCANFCWRVWGKPSPHGAERPWGPPPDSVGASRASRAGAAYPGDGAPGALRLALALCARWPPFTDSPPRSAAPARALRSLAASHRFATAAAGGSRSRFALAGRRSPIRHGCRRRLPASRSALARRFTELACWGLQGGISRAGSLVGD